jgi:hypothetical protein
MWRSAEGGWYRPSQLWVRYEKFPCLAHVLEKFFDVFANKTLRQGFDGVANLKRLHQESTNC